MKEITKDNWLTPPNNRWSFQNMSSIFDTTKLMKSSSPFLLSHKPESIEAFEFEGLNGKITIRQMLDESFTDAFIVLKNSEIQDETTKLINKYNKKLALDPSFETVILPLQTLVWPTPRLNANSSAHLNHSAPISLSTR